jgi:hypothetical protein
MRLHAGTSKSTGCMPQLYAHVQARCSEPHLQHRVCLEREGISRAEHDLPPARIQASVINSLLTSGGLRERGSTNLDPSPQSLLEPG